jgi:hypothetical protein
MAGQMTGMCNTVSNMGREEICTKTLSMFKEKNFCP